jgi:hypothetical protein
MLEDYRQRLKIPYQRLDDINAVLLDPDMRSKRASCLTC